MGRKSNMYQKSFNSSRGVKKGGFSSPRSKSKYSFASSASNNNSDSSSGRSQGNFVPYSSSARNSFSSDRNFNRSNGRNNGYRGNKRGNFRAENDYSKFIKKAAPITQVEEYVPQHCFLDFEIANELKNNIKAKGYETPTPIQDQSIPHIINGRDVIGIASTGTGKTAAFIIPLINKILNDRNQKVLIVTPTRELASQIDMEFREFSKGLRIFSVQLIGGASMSRQISNLYRNPQFIIGTPGRINDLIKRGKLRLHNVQNIVLDEVDRMVDMGFIEDIQKILSFLPQNRQSLFYSATISARINTLIQTFLNNPVTVSVKATTTPDNVEQDIVKVRREQSKIEVLHELLIQDAFEKVLIFGKTKRGVEELSNELTGRGFKATSIHGDKPQNKRERALRSFKYDELNILVATDVAARGLDINGVTHVINYDLPESYEDYVHRIGRTGRANNRGIALTFVT